MNEARKVAASSRRSMPQRRTRCFGRDATVGQMRCRPVEAFHGPQSHRPRDDELDGTARGGILVALSEVQLPVHFIENQRC
jgi:signal recognition particle GTPase